MDKQFITTGDGCRIAYRFDGKPNAPVLLLSNSLGTHMAMWQPQMAVWMQYFNVLRYDQRGHGASDAPEGAYSMDRLGRDVIELLDALQLDCVDFCGLSLGGMTGQWLGIREPRRLRRLVLANTSSFMGPPSNWDARVAVVLAQGLRPLAGASVERWFTSTFVTTAPDAIAPFSAMLEATNANGYAGCCAAIRDMDMRNMVTLIDIPTLIISGSHDPATPLSHSEALAKAIPNSHLVKLEAAHLSNVEQPAAFAREVVQHLQAQEAGSA